MPDQVPKKSKATIFDVLDTPAADLGLTGAEKAVLTAIASHLNPKRRGFEVWPSLARIADLSGFGVSTCQRAIKHLHVVELIKIQSDTGRANSYTVNAALLKSLANPGHSDRGIAPDPGHHDQGTPVTMTGDPGHCDHLTAKEQPIRTTERRSSLGCSRISPVGASSRQRQLAVHGLVASATDSVRVDAAEQPKEENPVWGSKRAAGDG